MLSLALVALMSPNPAETASPVVAADPPKKAVKVKVKVNEPDPADPIVLKDDPTTDKRFTERVTVRRYVGQKDFDYIRAVANVPALRREVATSRDGKAKEMRYYLMHTPIMYPKSEIIAEDGAVWAVKSRWTGDNSFNLRDGKRPLAAGQMVVVTLKTPAPAKK